MDIPLFLFTGWSEHIEPRNPLGLNHLGTLLQEKMLRLGGPWRVSFSFFGLSYLFPYLRFLVCYPYVSAFGMCIAGLKTSLLI
ncbi:hypothetical protein BDV41DRAFT_545399 [Aspergillus transmontanensis]|uniref:Uncharacterized protein n=1 Tax=Aspergillus transmontanensis TaxID=1034304 RepID=A0A5N6VP75_9EURO|nr:hypothetical protein BDV41DRAFT_545399 [Aspergillus transmontanensis]